MGWGATFAWAILRMTALIHLPSDFIITQILEHTDFLQTNSINFKTVICNTLFLYCRHISEHIFSLAHNAKPGGRRW